MSPARTAVATTPHAVALSFSREIIVRFHPSISAADTAACARRCAAYFESLMCSNVAYGQPCSPGLHG